MGGSRAMIVWTTSLMVVDACTGSDRVRGRPKPAKLVSRTLIVCVGWFGDVKVVGVIRGIAPGSASET